MVSLIWTAQGASGTTLMTSRSTDSGNSFEPSLLLTGTDAPGHRGWETLAAFADGRVAASWLDHRQLAADSDSATGHHQHSAATEIDSVAMAQHSQLYFTTLDSDPRPLTGGVCYCCKTAMATGVLGAAEAVGIAWRHVYPGNLRDIAFTVSRDGGRTFSDTVRVSEDEWSIAGCPDDGPAMAADPAGRVHLVWPTVVTEEGQPRKTLFHTVTSDGVSFSPRVRLPVEGQGNHPQVAVAPDGALMAIWDESGSGSRRIALAVGQMGPEGEMVFIRQTTVTGDAGVYPILVRAGDGMMAAWTSGAPDRSRIHVARLGADRDPGR